MDKQYNSIFVPEHPIDIANYITEIIICNYLTMVGRPRPQCPFWRKEIAANSEDLKNLSKRYQVELIGVKQLLKKFKPETLIKYFTDTKTPGFKNLKKHNQTRIIKELEELFCHVTKSMAVPIQLEFDQTQINQFYEKVKTNLQTRIDL